MPHFCGRTHSVRTRFPDGAGSEWRGPDREEVARLAYSYWEARGCRGGSPWEDWFRAERELRERNADNYWLSWTEDGE
jgi:hypothetical protein